VTTQLTILLATTNPHKIGEVRAIWAALAQATGREAPALASLSELGVRAPEPVEDQPTFEGNAVLKARYYALASGRWCLADDSGLEVAALAGEPGVRSARFAGVSGPRAEVDEANNALLLRRLEGVPADHRAARFVCALALCAPGRDEPLALVRGEVRGRIIEAGQAPRGVHGFGYDPLFLLPDRGLTSAELEPAEKNRISHRARACRLMWDKMLGLPRLGLPEAGLEA
jgi:XTP/dITP diphosphohydrolase